jgi:hypothetical protein
MMPVVCRAMFEPLRVHGAPVLESEVAPGRALLQQLIDARGGVTTASGRTLRLIAQQPRARGFDQRYESRIWLRGELQVRDGSWHDAFNVLVWLAFPRAKAALNARHYATLQERLAAGHANRGAVADALTLFDEGGVVIACAADDLADDLRQFRWKQLFRDKRERVLRQMRFYAFGHALHEKALRPFTGITGRAIVIPVEPAFFDRPPAAQLDGVDRALARHIADPRRMTATRELAPLPILGVPGWHPDNESDAYYDDVTYFRPGRHCAADGGDR